MGEVQSNRVVHWNLLTFNLKKILMGLSGVLDNCIIDVKRFTTDHTQIFDSGVDLWLPEFELLTWYLTSYSLLLLMAVMRLPLIVCQVNFFTFLQSYTIFSIVYEILFYPTKQK